MTTRELDRAALLARAHANYAEVFRALARALPLGAIEETDGLTLVTTGVPVPLFNPAFAHRLPDDPAAALARAAAFYRRAGMPWQLVALEEVTEGLAPAAADAGLVAGHRVPGMLLAPLDPTAARAAPGLEIQVVADADALRCFNDAGAAGSACRARRWRRWTTRRRSPSRR